MQQSMVSLYLFSTYVVEFVFDHIFSEYTGGVIV